MGLLDTVGNSVGLEGVTGKITDAKNLIKSPFSSDVNVPFKIADFKDGFLIEEILENGKTGSVVKLIGGWMPHVPFTFGGSQRFTKNYYSGYSEPTMQIFGPEETDVTINGRFYEKKFKDTSLSEVSTEIQQLIDSIRIRGSIVRLKMGEWERYAIISLTNFEMKRLHDINYAITFSIIGFNAPKNAKFLQRRKEVPFDINKGLIDAALKLQENASNIPATVPRSLADKINELTGDVAEAIGTLTGFVDEVFTQIDDIRNSINRIKGLVKHTQGKLKEYKNTIGGFDPFSTNSLLVDRYKNASFYSGSISGASIITLLLQRLLSQFSEITANFPLGRHFVKSGDNLQKIAIKFYGDADNWKKIYDYNNLQDTVLINGTILEIPRL